MKNSADEHNKSLSKNLNVICFVLNNERIPNEDESTFVEDIKMGNITNPIKYL